MAIVLSEGFGASTAITDFTSYGLLLTQGGASINTGGPLGDPYCAIIANNNTGIKLRTLGTALSTIYVGFRLKQNGFGSTQTNIVSFISTGGISQIDIRQDASNQNLLYVYRGSTSLGSVVVPSSFASAWQFFEVEVVISSSAGSVILREGGTTILSLTGVNTANDGANLNVGSINFGGFLAGGTPHGYDVTHIYITNNTAPNAGFLGDVRVFSRFPTANSAVQFTPTGLANNYQNAAKVPPVPATDYNTDATALAQDTFSGPSLPSGLGNIFAVGIKSLFQDSAAGIRTVGNVLISGATTANGTAVSPPASPSAVYQCDIFNTDPNTSAAWTAANAQATTFGYKIAS